MDRADPVVADVQESIQVFQSLPYVVPVNDLTLRLVLTRITRCHCHNLKLQCVNIISNRPLGAACVHLGLKFFLGPKILGILTMQLYPVY